MKINLKLTKILLAFVIYALSLQNTLFAQEEIKFLKKEIEYFVMPSGEKREIGFNLFFQNTLTMASNYNPYLDTLILRVVLNNGIIKENKYFYKYIALETQKWFFTQGNWFYGVLIDPIYSQGGSQNDYKNNGNFIVTIVPEYSSEFKDVYSFKLMIKSGSADKNIEVEVHNTQNCTLNNPNLLYRSNNYQLWRSDAMTINIKDEQLDFNIVLYNILGEAIPYSFIIEKENLTTLELRQMNNDFGIPLLLFYKGLFHKI
jgi:hypothetical protein